MAHLDQIGRIPAQGRAAAKSARELDYSTETITPATAKEWLALNNHNRPISKAVVRKYARDITSGQWDYVGDPFRFNGNGDLIDGAHRLTAIIEANVAVDGLIIRGLPIKAQEKLDQGRRRTAGDHLHLRGIDAGASVAAAVRQLINIAENAVSGSNKVATNAEVVAAFEKHPKLVDSVEAVGTIGGKSQALGLPPSLLSAIHYCGAHVLKDRDAADMFIGVFMTGEPTYDGDAAHCWRERLAAQTSKHAKLSRGGRRLGTVHAWNLFRRREPLKRFHIPGSATIDDIKDGMI